MPLWHLATAFGLMVLAACSTVPPTATENKTLVEPPAEPVSQPDSRPVQSHAHFDWDAARELPIDSTVMAEARTLEPEGDADRHRRHISTLASDAYGGRGIGTAGLDKAADYIVAEYKAIGLEPAGDDGSWFQTFDVETGGEAPASHQNFAIDGQKATPYKDFTPFGFSASQTVNGEAVFAGYGIQVSEKHGPKGYDDYAGLEVKDKIVLVLRHEPGRFDKDSPFDGVEATPHSNLRYKAHVAQKLGAKALIIVNDPLSHRTGGKDAQNDTPMAFDDQSPAAIPVVHMTWKAAARLLKKADFAAAQTRIDQTMRPYSRPLGIEIKLTTAIERRKVKAKNVVGKLPGSGPEAVVMGAHYDHLGRGGHGSLRPDSNDVHNGADDNASGVSVLLESARTAARTKDRARTTYFVAFAAEELGLHGSQYFVDHPPVPLKTIRAMINFDMVGRMANDTLHVSGLGSAKDLPAIAHQATRGLGLKLKPGLEGVGPSDHAVFYAKNIPVFFLFTGVHTQYHTPDDDAELIEFDTLPKITAYAARLHHYLSSAPALSAFQRLDVPKQKMHGDTGNTKPGYGPYFGSIPSFSASSEPGVVFQGVRAGSPAEKGGVQANDRLVEFNGTKIANLYDFTYALRACEVGQVVQVVLIRGEERVELQVKLGQRR